MAINAVSIEEIVRNFRKQLSYTEDYILRNGELKKLNWTEVQLIEAWVVNLRNKGQSGKVDLMDIESVILNTGNDFRICIKMMRENKIGVLSIKDRLYLLSRKLRLGARVANHYTTNGQGVMFEL